MNCSKCGATIQPGNRFCTKCGVTVQPAFQEQLVCTCGNSVASGNRFCPNCGAAIHGYGSAGIATDAALQSKSTFHFDRKLLWWFGGLFVFALIGKNYFAYSIGTLFLMGVLCALFIILRQPLAAILQWIGSAQKLKPVWNIMSLMPRPLRLLGGFVVPFILTYLMTPFLSSIFSGYGFLINAVSIMINTVVAYFFFASPPKESAQ